MPYIGSSASPLPVNFAAVQAQSFNGTGSQTAFTLSRTVPSAASIEVLVNNVQQSPYDASYSVSGTTLTFSEAPSSGTNNVYVVYRDQSLGSLVDESAYRKAEAVAKAGDTMTGALALPAGGLNVGSGQLAVDASGRVTMPYQPAFTAYNGTEVTGPTSAVIWTATELNRGSHYNTSNGRFTCPVAGVYVFHYRWLSKAGETIQPRLFKNGTGIDGATQYGNPPSGVYLAGCISVAIQCNANDYITCGTLSGAPLQGPNYNSGFSGFLLG